MDLAAPPASRRSAPATAPPTRPPAHSAGAGLAATLKRYLNGLLDLEQLGRLQRKRLAPFHRWVNTGFLPPRIRELMELDWTEDDEVRFRALMARTGRRNRRVPRPVRNFPFNALLWDFRARRVLRRPIV